MLADVICANFVSTIPADRTVTIPDEDVNLTNFNESRIKAWISMDGTGTVSINDSFNVSGIVDNGVGLYTITWDTDFANTNYVVVATCDSTADVRIAQVVSKAVGSVQINVIDNGGTSRDTDDLMVMAIGDQ